MRHHIIIKVLKSPYKIHYPSFLNVINKDNSIHFIPKVMMTWLVVSTPLKNMNVNWDDDIPNIWKNNSHVLFQSPPTRITNMLNIWNSLESR